MKLKNTLTIMILFFSISLFSQTSTTVKVTHEPGKTLKDGASVYDIPNWQPISSSSSNCFSFLSFRVFVKAKSKDELMYKVEASNSSSYSLDLDCSKWGLAGGGGQRTIKANSSDDGNGASFISSNYPEITFSSVQFSFPKEVRENYNVSKFSDYIKCGETAESYLNKNKNVKNEKLDNNEQTSNTSKKEVDNQKSENKGYEVIDVDTSAYEAEKEQKRQQAEQTAKRDSEQITKEDRKEQFKAKQLADSRNFINNQNAATERYDAALENLGNTLTTQFTEMANSWAKEQDYMNQISSLSQINSTSVDGIISEARQKQKQLEDVFDRKARDLDKELANSRTKVLAAAENETQAAVGELFAATATVIARRKLEKDEREARQNLERQKERELSKIAEKLKEQYRPTKQNALNAATLAVSEQAENYYLEQYDFADCKIKNANDIIRSGGSYCNEPKQQKFTNKNLTGKMYYDAYKRKKVSTISELKQKAEYFLELAIKKEPKNTKWLLEKLNNFELNAQDELAIMKRCLEIDNSNIPLKKKYDKKLRLYSNLKLAMESYQGNLVKDVSKNAEIQKIRSLNSEFEDVRYIDNNLYLVSRFSGKILKVKNPRSSFRNKVEEKLYGLVDSQGQILAPFKYKEIGEFSEDKATALIKNKYGFINLKGETVIPFKFKYKPSEFKNGYSIIKTLDKVWKLMFDEEKYFYKFIDSKGNSITNEKFDRLESFSEGLALTNKANSYKQNFMNEKGDVIIPLDKYYGVKSFSEGLAAVQIKSKKSREQSIQKWGFIDKLGNEAIEFKYDKVNSFVNGYAFVVKDNKKGIINKQDQTVIPTMYDEIYNFTNGYAIVQLNNKIGLINQQNEIIIPFLYDPNYRFKEMDFGAIIPNHIFLKKNNKWGVVNEKGEVVIDFKYNQSKDIILELL
jgi:hypothetical protein